jgi:hypothetical protein
MCEVEFTGLFCTQYIPVGQRFSNFFQVRSTFISQNVLRTTRAEPEDHLWSADHSLRNAAVGEIIKRTCVMKSGFLVCLLNDTRRHSAQCRLMTCVTVEAWVRYMVTESVTFHLLLTENLPRPVVGPSRKLDGLSKCLIALPRINSLDR